MPGQRGWPAGVPFVASLASLAMAGCQLLGGISDIQLVSGPDGAPALLDAFSPRETSRLQPPEAGTREAGAPDVGPHDATSPKDAPQEDAHSVEASPPDALAHDGGTPDAIAVTETIGVLGGAGSYGSGVSSLLAPFSGVGAGHFLAVMTAYETPGASVMSVTDDASNTYVSANVTSAGSCAGAEIWYARDVAAGISAITLNFNEPVTAQAWVIEATGLAQTGGVDMAEPGSGGPSTSAVGTLITPSGLDALIVSVVGSCGSVSGLTSGSPFVALEVTQGEDAAYYVAQSAGSYGPTFDTTNAQWFTSIAAFR